MPGVSKDGKSKGGYNYDIGGKVESIGPVERGEKSPPAGTLGRQHKLNTNRFLEGKASNSDPSPTYSKTGYESTSFSKDGYVKGGSKSEPKFLESDGSWAPAEGRGSGNTGNVAKRGKYSGTIKK